MRQSATFGVQHRDGGARAAASWRTGTRLDSTAAGGGVSWITNGASRPGNAALAGKASTARQSGQWSSVCDGLAGASPDLTSRTLLLEQTSIHPGAPDPACTGASNCANASRQANRDRKAAGLMVLG